MFSALLSILPLFVENSITIERFTHYYLFTRFHNGILAAISVFLHVLLTFVTISLTVFVELLLLPLYHYFTNCNWTMLTSVRKIVFLNNINFDENAYLHVLLI